MIRCLAPHRSIASCYAAHVDSCIDKDRSVSVPSDVPETDNMTLTLAAQMQWL